MSSILKYPRVADQYVLTIIDTSTISTQVVQKSIFANFDDALDAAILSAEGYLDIEDNACISVFLVQGSDAPLYIAHIGLREEYLFGTWRKMSYIEVLSNCE